MSLFDKIKHQINSKFSSLPKVAPSSSCPQSENNHKPTKRVTFNKRVSDENGKVHKLKCKPSRSPPEFATQDANRSIIPNPPTEEEIWEFLESVQLPLNNLSMSLAKKVLSSRILPEYLVEETGSLGERRHWKHTITGNIHWTNPLMQAMSRRYRASLSHILKRRRTKFYISLEEWCIEWECDPNEWASEFVHTPKGKQLPLV